jgi:FMNH2-dependent dimethyl sulfone monooxygenase
MSFGARHADYSFQAAPVFEELSGFAQRARSAAADAGKRDLGILAYGPMVCRDTDREVQDYVRYYVDERGDWGAARDLVNGLLAGGVQSISQDVSQHMQRAFVQGWYGYPLFGTPDRIVDEMLKLKAAGIDGIALSWVDFEQGVKDVNDKLLPLMQQAGLRVA